MTLPMNEANVIRSDDDFVDVSSSDSNAREGENKRDKVSQNRDEEDASEWYDDLVEEEVKEMTFRTIDDADAFYRTYARCLGFDIRKHDIERDDDTGFIYMRHWVCSKEGYRKEVLKSEEESGKKQREPRPCTRVGCNAAFRVRYKKDDKIYVVTKFLKQHNHEMVSQDCVPFLRSHRSVSDRDLSQAHAMRGIGWRTSDIMKYLALQAGGFDKVGYILKDLYNSLDVEQRKEIKDGDAEGAIAYLCAKKESDPSFFWDHDADDEGRLTKLFWCDSKSIDDYKAFGDVLVFDTTYRTNVYHRPLVILAGVNNHYMTVIFACALLSNESDDAYVWVLEMLMNAMDARNPSAVITDGDPAMKTAIEKVLPTARHRLCSWHIQNNALSHVHSEEFRKSFGKIIKLNCTEEEFENKWEQLVAKCGLKENSWVRDVFEKRSKWADAYIRGHFWGNMRSTQRCEGMNVFFKHNLDSKLRFYQFVRSFDSALVWLRHKEAEAVTLT